MESVTSSQLIQKGKTLYEVADIVQVDRSTISRVYTFIRDNAADIMDKYFIETLPMDLMKFVARLNAVSDEAWRVVERPDRKGDDKVKLRALKMARDTALNIVDIVTNNKTIMN